MDQQFQHAKQLYLSGLLYDCLTVCETILDQSPRNADALNLIGMLCFRGGDSQTALNYFEQAVAAMPNHAEALGNLALCYKSNGKMLEACDTYERALSQDDDDPQVHYNYAIALRQSGQPEQAARHLARAAELAPLIGEVFNLMGLVRAEMGQSELAVAAFQNAIAAHPDQLPPYLNLARALDHTSQHSEALKILNLGVSIHGLSKLGKDLAQAQARAGDLATACLTLASYVMIKNGDAESWEMLGDWRFRLGQFDESLEAYQQTVNLDASRARSHMQIFSIAQILDHADLALKHQALALKQTRLFTDPGGCKDGPVLLVLKAPGDWQINTPTDFILRPQDWGAIHHYYLDEAQPIRPDLPDCDIIFSAIAEPDRASKALQAAQLIVDVLGKPCLNPPLAMLNANREQVADRLKSLPTSIIPQVKRIRHTADLQGLDTPYLLRPTGTHAGNGMVLVQTPADLPERIEGDHYAIPYIDYASAAGQFRKYRVVVVGGVPYPFHLGLSVNWMVHYANARPLDKTLMDIEEERFLADISTVFSPALQADLSAMAQLLDLDFFAVDCGIHPDGRLVLFEVDAGAIIHTMDNPALYPYKHRFVPRIFDALAALIRTKLIPC